ncbi:Transcriptional regulator, LuxR family/hydrolase, alpha/beta fold family [Rhodovulum sp. P5]|uniref:alpha/beta fold hydrolase n=1 Tax=Rhodovulum sp. P5 TaxID=1564506 RepID=UPI0009C2AE7C|nr:alpha/beta fold hydrolase [Rhodovulum sp. P5]ARE38845.1 Transcriptional regulator, LuxR family/hydrolase, alpha/beta fold family [Rhodovulum sp. P5]
MNKPGQLLYDGGAHARTPLSVESDLICEIYGTALNPERYERLVDSWEKALAVASPLAGSPLDPQAASRHVGQAERIFDTTTPFPEIDKLFAVYEHLPALLLSKDGVVLRANPKAQSLLAPDTTCQAQSRADRPRDAGQERRTAQGLLRGKLPGSVVRRLPVDIEGSTACEFVILFDRAAISRVAGQIARAFDLTAAEQEVLGLSLQGLSRKEIAVHRDVSPETVKKQTKRIFDKTGAQSQLELTLISASMYRDPPLADPSVGGGKGRACALPFFDDEELICDGSRTVTYRAFGAPGGETLLFFHGTYGFCQWPALAEKEAARRGYRVIVPIRPGYGNTSGREAGEDVLDRIFEDILLILDRETAGKVTLVSLENDSFLAFCFAERFPGRVAGLVAFAGVLPMTREVQYSRMDKWHRFVVGTARYTPSLIPLVARGGFHFAARIGREEFVRQVYGSSRPDVAVMADATAREAILTGTRVAVSPRHLAHRAYAQEMCEFARGDWKRAVQATRDTIPVRFINGATDPIAPPETVAEFREDYPWITFEVHEDAGQFIFFSHWSRLFPALADTVLPQKAVMGAGRHSV